jgi:hypothetical protein
VPQRPIFIFISGNAPISCAHHKKTVETIEAPQNRRSYGKMKSLPLRPTYIGEKGRTLGKTFGIQVRCCWEHIGNLKGTYWEQWKNE